MDSFTVMTWNVESLFQPSANHAGASSIYQAKLALIARAISQIVPDVVALQEIGSPAALADLQQGLGGNYPHACLSQYPDARGIRVAFLSRLAIESSEHIHELEPNAVLAIRQENGTPVTTLRRGALRIRIGVRGEPVDILTAHLKSKLLSFPSPRGGTAFSTTDESLRNRIASLSLAERTAETVTIRATATRLLSQSARVPLIVLGDFNDGPLAATTQILLGPEGSQPGNRAFDLADRGDRMRLFNLANFIPADRRFSRTTHGERELLDQIFVSEDWLPLRGELRARPRVSAYPELVEGTHSITADPRARLEQSVPDHAPVAATFDLIAFKHRHTQH